MVALSIFHYIIWVGGDIRPKKKDCCVQVSEVKKIRVGRSKNIFILDFFFYYTCTEVAIEDWVLEVSFVN